jgi:uncharacterized heparinase superfamily protein
MKVPVSRLSGGWTKLGAFLDRGMAYPPIYLKGRWRKLVRAAWYVPPSMMSSSRLFFASLDLDRPPLSRVSQAVECNDYSRAEVELVSYFKARKKPRFHFDARDRGQICALVPADVKASTVQEAEAMCRGTFRFRGVTVHFDGQVDWEHCPRGNKDWTWDLNRHSYFATLGRAYWYTGDERYVRCFNSLLADWIEHNPVDLRAPNWESVFEVAYRINAWIGAYYLFRDAPSFDVACQIGFLKGLQAHARFLNTNIEYHVPNNHLLLEAKALALVGLLFPEFREATRWQAKGLRILFSEVGRQVSEDGVFKERATLYHKIVTGELLEMVALLRLNGCSVPASIMDRLLAMIDFQVHINKPDRTIPLFGDSALTDTYVRLSPVLAGGHLFDRADWQAAAEVLDEATVWFLGSRLSEKMASPHVEAQVVGSKLFPQGGYAMMRAGRGTEALYLAFDCGPFGYRLVPSHGHADALSFELYAHGHSLLVDPGVYSYHLGERWRTYFRSTQAHNTVVVDEKDQSVLLDGWHVRRPARVTLHRWITGPDFDLVDGSHDGYRRLSAPVTHRRQIFFAKPEYWVVVDTLTGDGEHCFDLYFHLGPEVEPCLDSATAALCTTNGSTASLSIVPLVLSGMETRTIQGQTDPIQGWVSFFSGEKQEAPVLCYRYRGAVPVQLCTLLYPVPAGRTTSLAISSLVVATDDGRCSGDESLTGLEIHVDSRIDYLVLDRRNSDAHKLFAGYTSDGPAIFLRGHGMVDTPA